VRLLLTQLPADKVYGIYNDNSYEDDKGRSHLRASSLLRTIDKFGKATMPKHLRWLHPEAARCFINHLSHYVVVSDMLRSAQGSLRAVREKRGAADPGYSGHNFGFSIDIAIKATLEKLQLNGKAALDEWMNDRGWFCHRLDNRDAFEAWHYNYLGDGYTDADGTVKSARGSTNGHLQAKIANIYGAQMRLTAKEAQVALASLKPALYHGEADGIWGKWSKAACRSFQRMFDLKQTGDLDTKTSRTLAFVTSEVVEVPL
jgi:hypothetical protein